MPRIQRCTFPATFGATLIQRNFLGVHSWDNEVVGGRDLGSRGTGGVTGTSFPLNMRQNLVSESEPGVPLKSPVHRCCWDRPGYATAATRPHGTEVALVRAPYVKAWHSKDGFAQLGAPCKFCHQPCFFSQPPLSG